MIIIARLMLRISGGWERRFPLVIMATTLNELRANLSYFLNIHDNATFFMEYIELKPSKSHN